ncbi:MAG: phosphoribosylanthranilate isomerase [Verrucomicrobiota bacterium]
MKLRSYKPRVKICCISGVAEAQMAIECGADALGLVSQMPSGPGVISDEVIAKIADIVPPTVATFLLTCRQDAESIIQQQRQSRVNTLQLCDRVDEKCYRELRKNLPGISLVQVVHVTGPESFDESLRIAPQVDAILLDSGNQNLAIKELGGTGRRHDWAISRQICDAVNVPVFLAGGLNSENVQLAMRAVGSFGLDVCSGVRSNGLLDKSKLINFLAAIHDSQMIREANATKLPSSY